MALTELLKKIADLNYERINKKIITTLKNELRSSKRDGFVFGLSGGLDSSVVASLLANAASEKTFAIVMPNDATPQEDVNDSISLAKQLNIQLQMIGLTDIHSRILRQLPFDKLAAGNLLARIRMCILYYHANQRNSLVVGTSDRSELLLGYFTKYGDGGADVLPIAALYKTQVRVMGNYLKLPDNILRKRSAPMLWSKHLAEEEIGMSYEEIDSILYCLFDMKLPPKKTAKKLRIALESVERIRMMHVKSVHKRNFPKICKL